MANDVRVGEQPTRIREWTSVIHSWAKSKGWWDDKEDRDFGMLCALLHSEVSEALEEYRNGHPIDKVYFAMDSHGNRKPEGIPVELADLVIRVFDTCEAYGIDLQSVLELKHAYNETRAYRHGGKRA